MISFNLYVQTSFSFNGSLVDVDKLVDLAAEYGYTAIGIADRSTLHAAIKFYRACVKKGIQPILGVRIVTIGLFEGESPFLAYAKNNTGYQNLLQISSYLNTTEPRLSLEQLKRFGEGLFFVALPDEGELHRAALADDYELAMRLAKRYDDDLPEWYAGIDASNFIVETKVVPMFERIGKTIVVNRVNYLRQDDRVAASILSRIVDESNVEHSGLFTNEAADHHFLTLPEINRRYADYPEAVARTKRLIEECRWSIDFTVRHLPRYPLESGETAIAFLKRLSGRGLERRFAQTTKPKHPLNDYRDRLAFELKVIEQMGYADYFLIVWDFVLYAKRAGILVGPGRGSAAGSLTSYVLGIVDVDPLEHDLFFERFLNPERITMPDIDMDFPDDRRDEVIRYVVDKYGKDHVTNIVAFGTFQGKSAIRDVGRILELPEIVLSEISEYLSKTDNSIDEFASKEPDKYRKLMDNPDIRLLFDVSRRLIDLPKHVSTHAAGIIITDENIQRFAPVQNGLLSMYQTQFEANDLEAIGLNKIDFLGIRNLKTIQRVIELIQEIKHVAVDIYRIPMNDPKTFAMLKNVHTLGVFQLESDGMMNLIRRMQLETFADISLCIALFRPGPMENIPTYLRRRFGEETVEYPHPDLQGILESTKGIIVYQEQIMQIARDFAGYSLGEADVLRRAVSKKSESELQKQRSNFISKAKAKGRDEVVANHIYDYIVKFANYGFNKSHSVAYALVAYWMAYLKANHPDIFMSVLMDSALGSQTATAEYLRECHRLNIQVLPPAINASSKNYRIENNQLRYPFLGIRSIGLQIAERIAQIQAAGPIRDFLDFVIRAKDINSRAVESLIMAGVFDEFGLTKKTMMENLKQVQSFAAWGEGQKELVFRYNEVLEYPFEHLQETEKELLGVNLRFHPIAKYVALAKQRKYLFPSEIEDRYLGRAKVIGTLTRFKKLQTKGNETMAFAEIEDQLGHIEAVFFPQAYRDCSPLVQLKQVCLFLGTIALRNGKIQLVVDRIETIQEDSQ
ncbi:MAG: DNA polymerase III subunit alpha [Bacillus subtilis]|nr:DNA polymerase III subunit alpha [Bacillus subtilis]